MIEAPTPEERERLGKSLMRMAAWAATDSRMKDLMRAAEIIAGRKLEKHIEPWTYLKRPTSLKPIKPIETTKPRQAEVFDPSLSKTINITVAKENSK